LANVVLWSIFDGVQSSSTDGNVRLSLQQRDIIASKRDLPLLLSFFGIRRPALMVTASRTMRANHVVIDPIFIQNITICRIPTCTAPRLVHPNNDWRAAHLAAVR
jgi:hypothetical protein